MKNIWLLSLGFLLIISCNNHSKKERTDNISDKKIRKEAFALAKTYVLNQLKDPKENTINGTLAISDSTRRYSINPSKIYIGLIDSDEKKDAIVTLVSFRGQDLDRIEHLIILRTGKKFMLIKVFESDMKILQLKDRVITAEIPTRPRTSPLYNCASCQAIVKYQYKDGDLVKIE